MKTNLDLRRGMTWVLGCSVLFVAGGVTGTASETPAGGVTPAVTASSERATAATDPKSRPEPKNLSYALGEVVRMAEAGVGDKVLLAYVENSKYVRFPTADEILYLRSRGVSDRVIAAALEKPPAAPIAYTAPQPAVQPQPASTATYSTTAVPQQTTVVYAQPAPAYVPPAPVYVAPPALSFGIGFGYGNACGYVGPYYYPRPLYAAQRYNSYYWPRSYPAYPYRYGSYVSARFCW